jgi:hypothetical protein
MALSKAERYKRLSWRAGAGASTCLIIWIVSMFGAVLLKSSDEHSGAWIGYVCGFSFLATLTSGVTCLAAAILSRFKSGDPEVSRPTSATQSE